MADIIDVVVIGAGHAGLAASYLLAEQGVEHVVLERGEVANSWRQERWDSLKLLTPNWQTRLPGFAYDGDDPSGYMDMAELIGFLDDYAALSKAPIKTHTRVTSVSREDCLYRVETSRGTWLARSVILASGACNIPSVPAVADNIPASITQLTTLDYRSPEQVADGGVLVVGASATGLQLADELLKNGHEVSIAVGEHVRIPRLYRERNIFDWMSICGIHDERFDEVDDIARGRRLPSPQLIGCNARPLLDLNSLTEQGASLHGRLVGIREGTAQFSGSLRNVCALADLKMNRLLNTIDEFLQGQHELAVGERFPATRVPEHPQLTMDLEQASVRTVIWATGFRPDYSWLKVPVLDRKGHLRHDGGIVDSPGLYALGLPLMRRRKSSFIFGIEDDAKDITDHAIHYLNNEFRSSAHGIHRHHSTISGHRNNA